MFFQHIPEPIKVPLRPIRVKLLSLGLPRKGIIEASQEERRASRDISVIVPIHGGTEVACQCLSSLEMYGANAEIIIVDDGSPSQETIDAIREFENRNGWAVIWHEEPRGVSRAWEAGAAAASRPYLCLLNSDTLVTQHSWLAPVRAFESDAKVAMTGPATSFAGPVQTIKRARHCRMRWNHSQICAFAGQYVRKQKGPNIVDVRFLNGFAFFMRKTVWDEFEGFDEGLPDYGNEMELCIRFQRAGYRVVWTRDSYIHHIGNHSYSDARAAKVARALVYIRKKHGQDAI